jgi:UDP-3-O-[3-hydroxymyristoyl] glucosamine N-acyltransferase
MKLKELADLTGGRILGNRDSEIKGAAGIKEAEDGDITFLSDKRGLPDISASRASAIITSESLLEPVQNARGTLNMLVVDNPQYSFAKALEAFYCKPHNPTGISDKAEIGSNIKIGSDVSVYPSAFLGNNVSLGDRVIIFPGVYIGNGVSIGNDSIVHPNVTIRERVVIGKEVIIHSGTVIGSDGFGYALEKGEHYKIPQIGGVLIEDKVEIGSNVSIDRATTGNTIVGQGTKIDNLVQIAHNVSIGKKCIIVSQVGISGSVKIGDGVVLAGQVGVKDHVKIGNGAVAAGQSGITRDIPEGQVYSGMPAIPHKTWLRAQSMFARLPEFMKRLQDVEKTIDSVISSEFKETNKEVQADDEQP